VSGSLAAALRGAAQDARANARDAMRQGLAVALGCLIGAVGLGFLTASAFLALEATLGAAAAALAVGIALSILGGGVLALARSRPPGPLPAGGAPPRLAAEAPPPPDAVPLLAFTAAFVLARYLTGRLRG
jgi:hypothetical protein